MKNKLGEKLLIAAKKGNVLDIKDALKCGADVDYSTSEGYTALMKASYEGHEHAVEVLLENNANPYKEAKGSWRYRAINYSINRGHYNITKMLEAAMGKTR